VKSQRWAPLKVYRWPYGLVLGFGFSGHGFKLSPVVGRVLAQEALGLPTEISLAPYSIERFDNGKLLVGKYGLGAVS
jgi:sarcosine oxidase subunit beta